VLHNAGSHFNADSHVDAGYEILIAELVQDRPASLGICTAEEKIRVQQSSSDPLKGNVILHGHDIGVWPNG